MSTPKLFRDRSYAPCRTALGRLLRELRLQRQMTLAQLSKRTQIDVGTLSNYESGTRPDRATPNERNLQALRDALKDKRGDLELAWLMARRDDMEDKLRELKVRIREYGR